MLHQCCITDGDATAVSTYDLVLGWGYKAIMGQSGSGTACCGGRAMMGRIRVYRMGSAITNKDTGYRARGRLGRRGRAASSHDGACRRPLSCSFRGTAPCPTRAFTRANGSSPFRVGPTGRDGNLNSDYGHVEQISRHHQHGDDHDPVAEFAFFHFRTPFCYRIDNARAG